MKYKVLGQTGLFVSEFCLGTMVFGASSNPLYAAATGVNQNDVTAILKAAVDTGINFIDTANVYSEGQSEEFIGNSIKSLGLNREDLVIATKFEHSVGVGPNQSGASRSHIFSEVKKSLKRLKTDYIDLYQMHGFDPVTPLEETLRTLNDLVREGIVRHVGISNWSAWEVARAQGIANKLNLEKFQSLQAYYSLVGRDVEREIIPMLRTEKLGLMVFSPLAGGYLTGKYRDGKTAGRRDVIQFPPVGTARGESVLNSLEPIAQKHGASMQAISLAWLNQNPVVSSVILGARNPEQLTQNMKASEVKLDSEDLKILDSASLLPLEYPEWIKTNSEAPRKELLKSGNFPSH